MSKKQKQEVEELPDDIEVVSPGQMLAQAREQIGLSQHDVAEKLNFRTTLVQDIEADNYDLSLPATFNRGYLKNYAKLVEISSEDVLASYESLNVAHKQGAEMQSFSKQTEKQAENNRLMWVTYLILALLIGSSVVWWIQDARQSQQTEALPTKAPAIAETTVESKIVDNEQELEIVQTESSQEPLNDQLAELNEGKTVSLSETLKEAPAAIPAPEQGTNEKSVQEPSTTLSTNPLLAENLTDEGIIATEPVVISSALFVFSGDCWVNIYDANGERVAWGIKKSGYEMNVSGPAPFTVTLGKPELVSITFDSQIVDMSQFNRGNIAKFTLPLNAENQSE